jgi:ubiquinone/menaquinone biosynthesis C-methylase UbiE
MRSTSKCDYRRHVLHYYNRFAGCYDWGEFIRRDTRRKTLALSGWRSWENVLDICTGTGELALAFARQGAEVVGVDIAKGVLECAATKLADPQPTWLVMDATNLGFKDRAFDIATISLALHHMPEAIQCRVLAEMARVTRRRIVIVEPHTPANPRLWSIWATISSWFDESEHMLAWARQDFAGTCRAAGLKIAAILVTTFGIHRITVCTPDRRPRHPDSIALHTGQAVRT